MHMLAEELSWWSDSSSITIRLDLSGYRDEVRRLREANVVVREESNDQRLNRLYNEAIRLVQLWRCRLCSRRLWSSQVCKLLGRVRGRSRGGHPKPMGGGATVPCWAVDTIAIPWLAAAIGAVHRSQPVTDLEDMAVVFVLALMTPDTQHTYMREFERFRPASLRLDCIIEQLASKISAALPEVIAEFLTEVQRRGACHDRAVLNWPRPDAWKVVSGAASA